MNLILEKTNKIAILNIENKQNLFFLYEDIKNPNFALLNLFNYCYFLYDLKNQILSQAFYQIFTEGLLNNESKYFVGFQKDDKECFANLYTFENGKIETLLKKKYVFVYPFGLITGKNSNLFAIEKISDTYKKVVAIDFKNFDENNYVEIIPQKYGKIDEDLFKDMREGNLSIEELTEKYPKMFFKR